MGLLMLRIPPLRLILWLLLCARRPPRLRGPNCILLLTLHLWLSWIGCRCLSLRRGCPLQRPCEAEPTILLRIQAKDKRTSTIIRRLRACRTDKVLSDFFRDVIGEQDRNIEDVLSSRRKPLEVWVGQKIPKVPHKRSLVLMTSFQNQTRALADHETK